MPRKLFTIIELIIVIAIIFILTAALLPALGKARQKARSISCTSNLKTIQSYSSFYSADFGDYLLPHSLYYATATNVTDCASTSRLTTENNYYYIFNFLGYIKESFGSFKKTGSEFICPEAQNTTGVTIQAQLYNGYTYGVSLSLSFEDKSFAKKRLWLSHQYKNPSAKIYAADVIVKNDPQKKMNYLLYSYWNGGAYGRHNRVCNLLWLDGHVASLTAATPADDALYTGGPLGKDSYWWPKEN